MKRKGKQWNMPKNLDMWQKDLQALIGKKVDMERKQGKQTNYFPEAEILNVDVKRGNCFKIQERNGKKRTLIGGFYDILELEEEDKDKATVPEMIDYRERAAAKEDSDS